MSLKFYDEEMPSGCNEDIKSDDRKIQNKKQKFPFDGKTVLKAFHSVICLIQ